MAFPPNQPKNIFINEKWGIYGELGEGSGVKIRFIQTVIEPGEFEKIKLVPDIQGSERWDVRDLFQREIDEDRVGEIKQYLENNEDVKFFNPLTIVVLPMNENKTQVVKETTFLSEGTEEISGQKYKEYKRDNFFKINIDLQNEFGRVAWNDARCNIAAIDGQHRLSALKRMHQEGKLDSLTWKIPVVLLTIEKLSDDADETITILEAVRRTFVNINEKSEHINECRKILLDDASITSMCVQELVELSHKNDNLEFDDRKSEILPLIFFDWQGVVKNRRPIENPASVKSIIEIREWFRHFLVGFDEKPQDQKDNLSLQDMEYGAPTSLKANQILTPQDAKNIRAYVQEDFIKGFNYFLINFEPYKEYIEDSREFEKNLLREDEANVDIAKQAFLKFKFGRCNPLENLKDLVDERHSEIKSNYEEKKSKFPTYLRMDIGMRGIMYSYGEMKRIFDKYNSQSTKWHKYAELITPYFNEFYNDTWWDDYEDTTDEVKKELLTYIMYNNLGSVQQYYKLENMKQYLGGFLVLFLISKIKKDLESLKNDGVDLTNEHIEEIVDEYGSYVRRSYEKGFKDFFKSEHGNDYGKAELNKKAKAFADAEADDKLTRLLDYLNLIDE